MERGTKGMRITELIKCQNKDGSGGYMNLAEMLEKSVNRYHGRIAISQNGREITFVDLGKRVNQICRELQKLSIGAGDHVGLYMSNGFDFVATYFAIQHRKAVA